MASKSKNIILIPHTKKIVHLKDNLSSLKFRLKSKDIGKLDKHFKPNYVYLKLKQLFILIKSIKNFQFKRCIE